MLTVPDLDESVVHRGASGGIQDPKVHEQLYPPVVVAVRTERPYGEKSAYGCDSLMSERTNSFLM